MSAQVTKDHYQSDYGFEGRFVSYFYQIREILTLVPKTVLEIGIGDKVLGSYLKNNTSIAYTSCDVASDLSPDVVADVRSLPFPDKSFDVVCAFEVLEHLPFEESQKAYAEMSRVARNAVIVSLPHFGPMLSFSCKIPFLPLLRFAFKIPFLKTHVFNGEHYWEIGKRGYSVSRVREVLGAQGIIVRDFVPYNSEYHHFFVITFEPALDMFQNKLSEQILKF